MQSRQSMATHPSWLKPSTAIFLRQAAERFLLRVYRTHPLLPSKHSDDAGKGSQQQGEDGEHPIYTW
jgi:hypothetical protein